MIGAAAAACVSVLLNCRGAAAAVEYAWEGRADGQFGDASRWTPAGGPPGSNDVATFPVPGEFFHTVLIPRGTAPVQGMRITGDHVFFDIGDPFTPTFTLIGGTSPSALLIQPSGNLPGWLEIRNDHAGLAVPNGGILLTGSTGDPAKPNRLLAGPVTADSITVSAGVASANAQVAHDVAVGNPGASPGSPKVASFFPGVGSAVGGA